jgi:hypothetical protein
MYLDMPYIGNPIQGDLLKKRIVAQIIIIALLMGSLGNILVTTNVYDDVLERIVNVICLSCVKLEPRTRLGFTFDTATGEPHPTFVLENLSNGPVFLHYRTDVCAACDDMEPILHDIFNVSYDIKDEFYKTILFDDSEVTFIHINLDHTTEKKRNSFHIYDKDNINGVPMFTIVTLGYHPAFVKPYYATGYGFLGQDDPEEAGLVIQDIIEDASTTYNQNRDGYIP